MKSQKKLLPGFKERLASYLLIVVVLAMNVAGNYIWNFWTPANSAVPSTQTSVDPVAAGMAWYTPVAIICGILAVKNVKIGSHLLGSAEGERDSRTTAAYISLTLGWIGICSISIISLCVIFQVLALFAH